MRVNGPLTREEFLKAMEVLQKGLSKTLKENNRLIFKELHTMQKRTDNKLQNMEERNQARHECW